VECANADLLIFRDSMTEQAFYCTFPIGQKISYTVNHMGSAEYHYASFPGSGSEPRRTNVIEAADVSFPYMKMKSQELHAAIQRAKKSIVYNQWRSGDRRKRPLN
jgi:hypothetical protein